MKKLICIILCILAVSATVACSNGSTTSTTSTSSTKAQASTTAETTTASGDIDLDLTSMSSTMIFSEVQNMMLSPSDYIGKKVRITGDLNVVEYEGNRYFSCIIADATACCAQGLEFDWAGDHSYPDDYPEVGTTLTVTGTFTTYMEGQQTYLLLDDADVQF